MPNASGGSYRANSVAALAFTGSGPESAVTDVEQRHAARGAPSRFTVSEVSSPADHDDLLARRGYERGADHLTLAKEVAGSSLSPPADVAMMREPTQTWLDIYLAGLSPDRRKVAPRLLGRPARPAHLFRLHAHRTAHQLRPLTGISFEIIVPGRLWLPIPSSLPGWCSPLRFSGLIHQLLCLEIIREGISDLVPGKV